MSVTTSLKNISARMGYSVERIAKKPSHSLMGLRRFDFSTIFDVGANRGQFLEDMLPNFPNATFHCFEPTAAAFGKLCEASRPFKNVVSNQLALGDKTAEIELNLHPEHDVSSSLLATTKRNAELYPLIGTQKKVTVKVERLDDYVAKLLTPLKGNMFIKLDVQGHEAAVLRGAERTLAMTTACLVEVLVDQLYVGQSTFVEIVNLMDRAGLVYSGNFEQAYDVDGRVIFLDALFIRP